MQLSQVYSGVVCAAQKMEFVNMREKFSLHNFPNLTTWKSPDDYF